MASKKITATKPATKSASKKPQKAATPEVTPDNLNLLRAYFGMEAVETAGDYDEFEKLLAAYDAEEAALTPAQKKEVAKKAATDALQDVKTVLSEEQAPRRRMPPEPEVTAAAAAATVDARKAIAAPALLRKPPEGPYLGINHHRETCIVLERLDDGRARYVPLNTAEMNVYSQDAVHLDDEYSPCDYPVERAAKLYLESARHVPTSAAALKALRAVSEGSFSSTTSQEDNMSKTAVRKAAAETTTKPAAKAGAKATKKAPAKKAEKKEVTAKRGHDPATAIKPLIKLDKVTAREGTFVRAQIEAVLSSKTMGEAEKKLAKHSDRKLEWGYLQKIGVVKLAG